MKTEELMRQLLDRVRDVEATPATMARIRQGIADARERRGKRRFLLYAGIASLTVATSAAAAVWIARPEPKPSVPAPEAESVARKAGPAVEPDRVKDEPAGSEPASVPEVEDVVVEPPRSGGAARPRGVAKRRASRSASSRPREPSDLLEQVQAYREAMALRGQADVAALDAWRKMRRRWPQSPMAHEIDLNIIEALGRLGRVRRARHEARIFLRRYPRSPRLEQIRALLDESNEL